mmetsp:Transcript_12959/g.25335  ORF Transcript_12959/g.25335 Transcript_12959/m.25335 type:complete len:626 (-) Transcript_12959:690-2567(-)
MVATSFGSPSRARSRLRSSNLGLGRDPHKALVVGRGLASLRLVLSLRRRRRRHLLVLGPLRIRLQRRTHLRGDHARHRQPPRLLEPLHRKLRLPAKPGRLRPELVGLDQVACHGQHTLQGPHRRTLSAPLQVDSTQHRLLCILPSRHRRRRTGRRRRDSDTTRALSTPTASQTWIRSACLFELKGQHSTRLVVVVASDVETGTGLQLSDPRRHVQSLIATLALALALASHVANGAEVAGKILRRHRSEVACSRKREGQGLFPGDGCGSDGRGSQPGAERDGGEGARLSLGPDLVDVARQHLSGRAVEDGAWQAGVDGTEGFGGVVPVDGGLAVQVEAQRTRQHTDQRQVLVQRNHLRPRRPLRQVHRRHRRHLFRRKGHRAPLRRDARLPDRPPAVVVAVPRTPTAAVVAVVVAMVGSEGREDLGLVGCHLAQRAPLPRHPHRLHPRRQPRLGRLTVLTGRHATVALEVAQSLDRPRPLHAGLGLPELRAARGEVPCKGEGAVQRQHVVGTERRRRHPTHFLCCRNQPRHRLLASRLCRTPPLFGSLHRLGQRKFGGAVDGARWQGMVALEGGDSIEGERLEDAAAHSPEARPAVQVAEHGKVLLQPQHLDPAAAHRHRLLLLPH